MEAKEIRNGNELVIEITGRLDTAAANKFNDRLSELLKDDITSLVMDMENCDYVASSGLRAILSSQMEMTKKGGSMVVKNVCEGVMEVFEMTGFASILTIE